MSTPRWLVATLSLIAVLACSTACGSSSSPTPPAGGAADLPLLRTAWTSGVDTYFIWVHGHTLVNIGTHRLEGTDTRDGSKRWDTALPAGYRTCVQSPVDARSGVGGLVLSKGVNGRCNEVVAVDLADGSLLWHRRLTEPGSGYDDTSVSVSRPILTASFRCGDVRRFQARTGTELPPLQTSDGSCVDEAALGETHVATYNSDPGTTASFRLFDAESGRRLWSVRAGVSDHVEAVISERPTVLQVIEDGHRVIREFGRDGTRGPVIGKPLPLVFSRIARQHLIAGTADGVLVINDADRTGHAPNHLIAYDMTTGRQLWTMLMTDADSALEVDAAGVLLQRAAPPGVSGAVFERLALRTGTAQVLGRVQVPAEPTGPTVVLDSGHRIVYAVQYDSGLRAVDLPRS